MAFRSVLIQKPAYLQVRQRQLLVKQDDTISIPLEDIAVLVLENRQITVSVAALALMVQEGLVIYVCDDRHIPNGLMIPFLSHCRQTGVLRRQIEFSVPFKKRVWQRIIRAKIINQSICLDLCGEEGSSRLRALAAEVKSGDGTYRESVAARFYFQKLFTDFKRFEDDPINAALNYGYAILRGAIARSLVAYGFIPSLGIHHDSELNAWNLADDFLEPFRPMVDLIVHEYILNQTESFQTKQKHLMMKVLNQTCLLKKERLSVLSAINRVIAYFSTACKHGDYQNLSFPEILPLGGGEVEPLYEGICSV